MRHSDLESCAIFQVESDIFFHTLIQLSHLQTAHITRIFLVSHFEFLAVGNCVYSNRNGKVARVYTKTLESMVLASGKISTAWEVFQLKLIELIHFYVVVVRMPLICCALQIDTHGMGFGPLIRLNLLANREPIGITERILLFQM